MIILQDTREQLELDWSGIEGIEEVIVKKLDFGDYGAIIHGQRVPITLERKGFGDLWTTMASKDYPRFKRVMNRAKVAKHKFILAVEGTYTEIWDGNAYSTFGGPSMLKKLAMLHVRYDLETWMCESRRVMARRIVDMYSAVERHWGKQQEGVV